jgi:putative heme-binding domain-containing protein
LFPERYIARNPHLPVRENKKYLANYDDSLRVFAISEPLERFNDPNGLEHVTSGCSVMPYRDDLFGLDFATSAFTCEPVHNIVHREVIEPDSTTFKSHRAPGEEQSEFVASSDNWFRPVMAKTGPDGALYIADMYRLVIEHPEWISADRQKRIDLRAGADKGRTYRVYPENAKLRPIPNLAKMNTGELVAALESPSGWQRDTAQRLLVDKQDKTAIEPVRRLVTRSTKPKTRVQALATLDGLGGVTPTLLNNACRDSNPRVREFAIRTAEPQIRTNLLGLSFWLVDDPEIRVRYQTAFSLGESDDSNAGHELAIIALKDWKDPQMQIAVMSSATKHVDEMMTTVLARIDPPGSLVEQLFSLATASGGEMIFVRVLREISPPLNNKFDMSQFIALAGFLDGLERKGSSLKKLYNSARPDLRVEIEKLSLIYASAREAADPSSIAKNPVRSLFACRLLGRGLTDQDEDVVRLGKLLGPQVPTGLQSAAMASLKKIDNNNVAEVLLSNWQNLGPNLKGEAVTVLLSRNQWLDSLLGALEKGKVPPGQIGTVAQQKLLANPDPKIKARTSKLFAVSTDRQKVLQEYAQVESLKGDPKNGRALFVATCAQCHRFRDEGNQVGPDLAMMSDKPVSDFLRGILNPNQAIEARYLSYTATTKNGREVTGVISTETANSITLKMAGGTEETVLRSDLKELKSGGLSLMPDGFENALKPQAMADLISYLKSRN